MGKLTKEERAKIDNFKENLQVALGGTFLLVAFGMAYMILVAIQ
jgi:hypothetical protein